MAFYDMFDVRRAEWDQDEDPVTFTRTLADIGVSEIHHTGARGPVDMSFAAKRRWLLAIEYFHEIGKGWTDIFYHVFVFADGEVWEGRDARRTSQGNIGDALTIHIPGNNPALTVFQKESLLQVLRWVGGPVRDHKGRPADTYCAGDNIRAELDSLRAELSRIMEPENLGTHPDAISAAAKGFLHNNEPDRPASRSVVGVVANRVDDASRERYTSLGRRINTLSSELAALTARVDTMLTAAPTFTIDDVVEELQRRLEE